MMAKKKHEFVPEDWAPEKVTEWREKRGMSTTQLAAAIGKRAETVENWEAGRTRPLLPDFLALLRVLELDFWDLMP